MNIYYSDAYTIHTNPSEIGGGYVVTKGDEIIEEKVIHKRGMTNNEMELIGVGVAVNKAENGSIVYTDSQNTFYWVRSGKPKARPDLAPLALSIHNLVKEKEITLKWIPREQNIAGIIIENREYADMIKGF